VNLRTTSALPALAPAAPEKDGGPLEPREADRPRRTIARVIHLSNLDTGLRTHLRNYLLDQRRRGYEVSVVCHPGSWLRHDTETPDGIPVTIMRFPPAFSPFTDLTTLVRLVAHFRRERADIVHTHTVKPGFIGRLAARLAGVPVIVHTVHGFYFYEGMNSYSRRMYQWLERIAAGCCNAILSQNEEDLRTAVREGICLPEKISLLGNGIDLQRFRADGVPPPVVATLRRELGIPAGVPVVGIIGRPARDKGFLEFIQAARILRERGVPAHFVVAGAAQRGKADAMAPEALLTDPELESLVHVLGPRSDIPELMSLLDVIVLPSHGREGIPRVLMEAAAMSKPVVATDVRGCREAVVDGVTGLLVPARNGAALADGIQRLLCDPELARRLGAAGRARAEKLYDERAYFERTEAVYRRLLEARRSTLEHRRQRGHGEDERR
jgi:glycosyltransferase involved in cell wall biosynthesis